jgi:CheY-like chemotaxis protein
MGRELDGKLVLVIEDHAPTREGLAALLDDAGAIVETAQTIQEAVHIFREAFLRGTPPEAIVCDMVLPDEHGSALPDYLREIDPDWRGPLVGVSAYPDSETVARASGFHDFLPKLMTPLLPITLAHLFRSRPHRP